MAYRPVICYSEYKNYIVGALSRTLKHNYESDVAEIFHCDNIR